MSILIFGANGMLGTYVSKYFLQKYKNIVLLNRNNFDIYLNYKQGILEQKIREIIASHSPYFIINCAGITNRKMDCPELFCVNSYFPIILGEICSQNNIGLIHPSTDCVFSGKKGDYIETDIPDPKDNYGLSKFIGEHMPFTKTSKIAVIRVSIIGKTNSNSLMDWIFQNENKNIVGYTDHFWNGITCLEYAKIMERIINENNWNGLYHIESETISKYNLINMICNIYKINLNIKPVEIGYSKRTLKSTKTNIKIQSLENQIQEMRLFDYNIYNSTEKLKIDGKNIVIITSAISAKSYFTPETRLKQTFQTISTIKEKIPNSTIVLIEITKIPLEYSIQLAKECNFIILCEKDPEIQNYNQCLNKSCGEVAIIKKILSYISNCETIYKISGRYFLRNDFHITDLDKEKYNFYIGENCFHTTFYSIPGKYIEFTYAILNEIHPKTQKEWLDIEHAYFQYLPKDKIHILPKLNCQGFYSNDGKLYQT